MNDNHYFNSGLQQLKIQNFAQVYTHTSTNTQTRFRDGAASASLLGKGWETR